MSEFGNIMATRDEALSMLRDTLIDVDVAIALAQTMHSYAATCKKHSYRISPATMKMYADRIVRELRATTEQNNAQL